MLIYANIYLYIPIIPYVDGINIPRILQLRGRLGRLRPERWQESFGLLWHHASRRSLGKLSAEASGENRQERIRTGDGYRWMYHGWFMVMNAPIYYTKYGFHIQKSKIWWFITVISMQKTIWNPGVVCFPRKSLVKCSGSFFGGPQLWEYDWRYESYWDILHK